MAEYIKTVDPNGGADYSSLAAWEAGEQALYSSGDVAIADCKRTGPTKDTTKAAVSGWVDGVVPKIIANPLYRHEGWWATTRLDGNYFYTLEAAFTGDGLLIQVPGTIVSGIALYQLSTGYDKSGIHTDLVIQSLGYPPTIIDGNLIKGGRNPISVYRNASGGTLRISNNIVMNSENNYSGIYGNASGNLLVLNNTVVNCSKGIERRNYGNFINNVSMDSSVSCFTGTFTADSNNNVSSDATAPGTIKAINQKTLYSYFKSVVLADFHLTDSSSNLFGIAGADLSAYFSTDIDGNTRTSWDVGADETVIHKKTVDPNGGSDYTSLSAWEAGEQTLYNIHDIAVADCKRTGPTKDTSVSINGWTVGVIPKIIVNPAHRHEGRFADTRVSDGNYIYTNRPAGYTHNITVYPRNAFISGLVADMSNGSVYDGVGVKTDAAGTTVEDCIFKNAVGNDAWGLQIEASYFTGRNNVIYGFKNSAGGGIKVSFGVSNARLENNTVYNCYRGVRSYSNSATFINNIVLGSTLENFKSSYDVYGAASTCNVSSDATAPGTITAHNQEDYSDYFVDPANGDFHLKDTSQNLWGIASANLYPTFTTDIDGDTRPDSDQFGIGVDFYVAAGGGGGLTTLQIDALIQQGGVTSTSLLDALVQASFTSSITLDALIAAVGMKTFSFDALIQAVKGQSVSVDALVQATAAKTISVDALIYSLLSSACGIEALIQTVGGKVTSFDALIQATKSGTVSLDAIIASLGGSFTSAALDALVQSVQAKAVSLDALVMQSAASGAFLDAILFYLGGTTVSLDALIQGSGIGVLSLDAIIQLSGGRTVSLDALVQVARQGSCSIDAILTLLGSDGVHLDAYIASSGYTGLSLDAVIGALIIISRETLTGSARNRFITGVSRRSLLPRSDRKRII